MAKPCSPELDVSLNHTAHSSFWTLAYEKLSLPCGTCMPVYCSSPARRSSHHGMRPAICWTPTIMSISCRLENRYFRIANPRPAGAALCTSQYRATFAVCEFVTIEISSRFYHHSDPSDAFSAVQLTFWRLKAVSGNSKQPVADFAKTLAISLEPLAAVFRGNRQSSNEWPI